VTAEPTVIVVELKPYRDRRRARVIAAGILLGLCWYSIIAPALAELVGGFLDHDPGVGEG
jgi:hypothetical protein